MMKVHSQELAAIKNLKVQSEPQKQNLKIKIINSPETTPHNIQT
jgi:hypothetical protein